jgi:hypothetical protein
LRFTPKTIPGSRADYEDREMIAESTQCFAVSQEMNMRYQLRVHVDYALEASHFIAGYEEMVYKLTDSRLKWTSHRSSSRK